MPKIDPQVVCVFCGAEGSIERTELWPMTEEYAYRCRECRKVFGSDKVAFLPDTKENVRTGKTCCGG